MSDPLSLSEPPPPRCEACGHRHFETPEQVGCAACACGHPQGCACDGCRIAAEKPVPERADDPVTVGLGFSPLVKFHDGRTLLELARDWDGGRQYLSSVAATYQDSGLADAERNARATQAWLALTLIRRDGKLNVVPMPRRLLSAVIAYVAKCFLGATCEADLVQFWRLRGRPGDLRDCLWQEAQAFLDWAIYTTRKRAEFKSWEESQRVPMPWNQKP